MVRPVESESPRSPSSVAAMDVGPRPVESSMKGLSLPGPEAHRSSRTRRPPPPPQSDVFAAALRAEVDAQDAAPASNDVGVDVFAAAIRAEAEAQDMGGRQRFGSSSPPPPTSSSSLPPRSSPPSLPPRSAPPRRPPPRSSPRASPPTTSSSGGGGVFEAALRAEAVAQDNGAVEAPFGHSSSSFGDLPPRQSSTHPLLSSAPPRPPSDHPLLSGLPPRGAGGGGGRGHHSRTVSAAPALGGGRYSDFPPAHSPVGRSPRSSLGATDDVGGEGAAKQQAPPRPSSGSARRAAFRGHRRVQSLPSTGRARTGSSSSPPSKGENGKKKNAETLEELMAKLEARRKKYGQGHFKVGLAHNLIGNYYFRRGQHDLAARYYDDALQCFKGSCSNLPEYNDSSNSSGDDSSSTLSDEGGLGASELRHQLDVAVALGNIGAVFWSTGRLSEAVESLEKCVAIRSRVLAQRKHRQRRRRASNDSAGSDDERTEREDQKERTDLSGALYSLGLARSLRGDYNEALDALNRSRDALLECLDRKAKFSGRDEAAAAAAAALASGRQDGRSALARSMDEQASRYSSEVADVEVELARVEDARGKVHVLMGDARSALDCHLKSYRSKSAVLGRSHPSALCSLTNAAEARSALGMWDEAESDLRDVLAELKLLSYKKGLSADARKKLELDTDNANRVLGEVQREKQRRNRRIASMGAFGSEFMAAIAEETDHGVGGGLKEGHFRGGSLGGMMPVGVSR